MMSNISDKKGDSSTDSVSLSRNQMPPPPPRLQKELGKDLMDADNLHHSHWNRPLHEKQQSTNGEPSFDTTLSLSSLATADTDAILTAWRKERQHLNNRFNSNTAVALQLPRQGTINLDVDDSILSVFDRLDINKTDDDSIFNYSDSFSMREKNENGSSLPNNHRKSSGSMSSNGKKTSNGVIFCKSSEGLQSTVKSPIRNGSNNMHLTDVNYSALIEVGANHDGRFNEAGYSPGNANAIVPTISYNNDDDHMSANDINTADMSSSNRHIDDNERPQNLQPQHHFDTDLSIISHSSESVSSAFLAGLRSTKLFTGPNSVADIVPTIASKPSTTSHSMEVNAMYKSNGKDTHASDSISPHKLYLDGKANIRQSAMNKRDKIIHDLERELLQLKERQVDLEAVMQQQSSLNQEIVRLNQQVEKLNSQCNSLNENIRMKQEELLSLRADIQFAQTEKEQIQKEYDIIHDQINALTKHLDEKRAALIEVERDQRDAIALLEKAKTDYERVMKESNEMIEECRSKELVILNKTKHLDEVSKKLRMDQNRLQNERSQIESDGAFLKSEKEKFALDSLHLSNRQANIQNQERHLQKRLDQLGEEKKKISLVQNDLLHMQSAQANLAAKLKTDEQSLEEYSRSLKQQVEILLSREESCSKLEALIESRFQALSAKEKLCAKQEVEIMTRAEAVSKRESACSQRESKLTEAFEKMSEVETQLFEKEKELTLRNDRLFDREKTYEKREENIKMAENSIKKKEDSVAAISKQNDSTASDLLCREQDCAERERIISQSEKKIMEREADCADLEKELAEASDAVTQREQLCAEQLENANLKIQEFLDREKVCSTREIECKDREANVSKREKEIDLRSKQLLVKETTLAGERKAIDSLTKSISEKEASCSKRESLLNERSKAIEENENEIKSREKELNLRLDELKLEKEQFENSKNALQLDLQRARDSIKEQNQNLIELNETHELRIHKLRIEEELLTAAKEEMDKVMNKLDEEQKQLLKREIELQEALSNLGHQTTLLNSREETLNTREKNLIAQGKEISQALIQLAMKEKELQSSTADLTVKEQALTQKKKILDSCESQAIELTRNTEAELRQKQASITTLEDNLKGKEQALNEKNRILDQRLSEIMKRETCYEQSIADLDSQRAQLDQKTYDVHKDAEHRQKDLSLKEESLKKQEKDLFTNSIMIKSKVSEEEQRYRDLQSKTDEESKKLESLRQEAVSIHSVLNEAALRFEREAIELGDMVQRKQTLIHEVSLLEEKVKNADKEEERALASALASKSQHQEEMIKLELERRAFKKLMDKKTQELSLCQKHTQAKFISKAHAAMKQICDSQMKVFEDASLEILFRHHQIEVMVSNIRKLQLHFFSLIEDNQKLSKKLSDSLKSLSYCKALVEEKKINMEHVQQQCNQFKATIKEQNQIISEIEQDKVHLQSQTLVLEKKASDLESSKNALYQELEQIKVNKSIHIEHQAQKLKELMKSITVQNDKLLNKQNAIKQKESEFFLFEHNLQEEVKRIEKVYRLVQDEKMATTSLKQDLDAKLKQQELKEKDLLLHEERLTEIEKHLIQSKEDSRINQQKMKELAKQLQKRNEEMIEQKKLLQVRLHHCDEYEANLSAWEKRLDDMANIIQENQNDLTT